MLEGSSHVVVNTPEIEIVVEAGDWPPKAALRKLARRAVKAACAALGDPPPAGTSFPPLRLSPAGGERDSELSIVFTDDAAMRALNKGWRGKDKPTNVLSFPQESPVLSGSGAGAEARGVLLGDVILAAETVAKEAAVADKPLEDHMAHLIVHGFLHLLGYDHQDDAEAEKMEQLERVALKRMGIPDPYATAKRQ